MSDLTVRPRTAADADAVLAIYQAGLHGGNAGFEHTAPGWAAFDAGGLLRSPLTVTDVSGSGEQAGGGG